MEPIQGQRPGLRELLYAGGFLFLVTAMYVMGYRVVRPRWTPQTAIMLAVPSFSGTMPDGTPVIGIVSLPAQNVSQQSTAWTDFIARYPELQY